MPTATITARHQLTLPKSIRDHLNLKPGDRVEFFVADDGSVTVWPVTADIRSLKGIVKAPERPVTVEKMNEAIQQQRH